MEDAMRSFLNEFPIETFQEYDKWMTNENYHVRRLVSESTRPSLPWSRNINVDYRLPIKYLETLHVDKTRYVTRSVANHLNDISKKDPQLVVKTLKRWQKDNGQSKLEMDWIIKHSLRTLVKKGNEYALAHLGYSYNDGIKVKNFTLSLTEVTRGVKIEFCFEISTTIETALMIDYRIDFVKANGETKPKVFKLKKLTLMEGESKVITKRHHLKADATTFKLRPGKHALTLQINGKKLNSLIFNVS